MDRIFILSPPQTSGKRAAMLLNERAEFDLAARLRGRCGAPLGDVFSFLSGLYFRGKLTYSKRFGHAGGDAEPCYVITSNSGLISPDAAVTVQTLRAYADVPIDAADERYAAPLRQSADELRRASGAQTEIVLLGSIATGKYVDPLLAAFGDRLLYPLEFVGRGDMSRGGLLLRAADSGVELQYGRLADAERRRGPRPPKLAPLPRRRATKEDSP
jgi:hypothetical protein